jgi:hypothetical protein
VDEIIDGHEVPEVAALDRPVVLLPVPEVGTPLRRVQVAGLRLRRRHRPEGVAVAQRRHAGPHHLLGRPAPRLGLPRGRERFGRRFGLGRGGRWAGRVPWAGDSTPASATSAATIVLRAILRGTRAPEKLAKHRDKGCKASEAEIAQALTGSYREEHLFELKLAYEAWQFTLGQVAKADGQIALQLGRMKCDRALPPLKPKARPKRRVNSPGFDVRTALYYVVGLDLTEIEGISELTALTVISEIGPGVSRFATVKQFCSWLGLCPNWQKTGGRVKSSRTRRGVNRAAQALRMAAQSLHHSQGALGGFLRRMKGRLGAQAAVTATAHKLARIVYLALKHGLTYVRQSQEEYEARMKEKQIKALKRKARQLGLDIVEKAAGGFPGATAASAQG